VADIDPPTAAAENPVLGTQFRIRVERIRETALILCVSVPFFYPQHQHFTSPVAQAILDSLQTRTMAACE
jgi:hypothetical protein